LQIATAELVGAEAAAAFVSAYVDYRPLVQPYVMPDAVQHPAETLKLRSGTCLDTALLLCSILLGQGADAAVVIGYAPPGIVENVQRSRRCPAPAVQQRLDLKHMVTEFLASCGSHVAAKPGTSEQQQADAGTKDSPSAEHIHRAESSSADQQPAADTAGTTAAPVEAAAVDSNGAAAAAADDVQTDSAPASAQTALNSAVQQPGKPDACGDADSPQDTQHQQQSICDSKPAACPYRLHAWVLVGRKVSDGIPPGSQCILSRCST
jgi:Transglutaminase-like superfamily